ncbi:MULTISPECIES: DUF3885 domain-containing protein [Niastella]|uniref:DUF3885 domain-containing protein n=1 Tax=Niastella soli TaxID=2821487 RepID=A0ABS3YZK0_9BACT|nr:DUF3885 domain-containing protein [Niastella soli]MBO9203357.1 DUF3885 domain-containing protein [Niastella soli]
MLRQELQSYFDKIYPYSQINTQHTLRGQVEIRFELGEGYPNGSIDRVNQATERAITLFTDTFQAPANEIFVLIYEYQDSTLFEVDRKYLYKQFPEDLLNGFYNQLEFVNSRMIITNENGNKVFEKYEARIVIGKLPVKDINARNIFNAIANTEMGFDPGIDQSIYFFDPLTDKGFHMYDDRGCYVWSKSADKIRDIYINRNNWIINYHRPEIDEYFK